MNTSSKLVVLVISTFPRTQWGIKMLLKSHFRSYTHAFPLQNESMQWKRLSLLWKGFIAMHYERERPSSRGGTDFSSPFLHASRFCIKQTVMHYIFPLKPPAESNKVWQFTLFIQGLIKVHWALSKSLISQHLSHYARLLDQSKWGHYWFNVWDCFY